MTATAHVPRDVDRPRTFDDGRSAPLTAKGTRRQMTDKELAWFKSSYSGGENNECVEVAFDSDDGVTFVRDSKEPEGGLIAVSPRGWAALLAAVQEH